MMGFQPANFGLPMCFSSRVRQTDRICRPSFRPLYGGRGHKCKFMTTANARSLVIILRYFVLPTACVVSASVSKLPHMQMFLHFYTWLSSWPPSSATGRELHWVRLPSTLWSTRQQLYNSAFEVCGLLISSVVLAASPMMLWGATDEQ